jgi:hypothetical protein
MTHHAVTLARRLVLEVRERPAGSPVQERELLELARAVQLLAQAVDDLEVRVGSAAAGANAPVLN